LFGAHREQNTAAQQEQSLKHHSRWKGISEIDPEEFEKGVRAAHWLKISLLCWWKVRFGLPFGPKIIEGRCKEAKKLFVEQCEFKLG